MTGFLPSVSSLPGQTPPETPSDPSPTIQAERMEGGEGIHLDGRLDEPVWERAVPATGFRQQEPREGAPAQESTEVRVVYDEDALYLGVTLHDSDPDGIIAFQRERDASLSTDDRFMWVLDTFGDGRGGYYFETNPEGLMGDGLLQGGSSGGSPNMAWDGIWDVQVVRGAHGWTAEIRIPFRTLNFDPNLDAWGINFQRTVRRTNEETVWSGYRRNQGLTRTQNAGRLEGLHGITQGLGVEAQLYGKLDANQRPMATDPDWEGPTPDMGVDLTYSVTPNLRASATVNTDFAEIEVDERQVNLTRFPLFFPEQRDFFLEGSSVFTFARPIQIHPYFSRRIGLVDGEAVPLRFGGRLAGQVGRNDLGFLQIRTGSGGGHPGEDFTVGRVVRRVLGESSMGVLFTRRAGYGRGSEGLLPDRHTVGLDYDLFTSSFRGNRNLQLHGFFIWNDEAEPERASSGYERTSFGSRLAYTSSSLSTYLSVRRSGKAYGPAVGFTPRNDFRHIEPLFRYTLFRPDSDRIRSFGFFFRTIFLTDDDSFRTQSVNSFLTPVDVRFESGAQVSLQTRWNHERLDEEFSIAPGVVIPPARYRFQEWEAQASLPEHWRVSGDLSLGRGTFWSGNRTFFGGFLTLRPSTGTSLSPGFERSDVTLPGGSFSTHLLRLRGSWHLTPRASMLGIGQYDNQSEVLGSFLRFRWILRPGNDLYLVYVHNWAESAGDYRTLERQGAAKLTYTHRF